MKTRYVVILAAASLLLSMGLLFLLVSPRSGETTGPAVVPPAAVGALDRMHAASVGNPEAKVHIVEFMDPACETCRDFYPFVKKLMAAHPDRIRLSVRHVAFHKGSDVVVKALEASKRQGKYWQTLEALLASQPTWVVQHSVKPDLAWAQLASVGLDLDRLKADMESPEVARNVALDAEDAKLLKVTQTPEYFVNGRSMATFGYEPLQQLVTDAVANAYR